MRAKPGRREPPKTRAKRAEVEGAHQGAVERLIKDAARRYPPARIKVMRAMLDDWRTEVPDSYYYYETPESLYAAAVIAASVKENHVRNQ